MRTRGQTSAVTLLLVGASFVALAAACAGLYSEPFPPIPRDFPSELVRPKPEVVSSRALTNRGGPMDWCAAKNVIAYAYERTRIVSEIYTIDPSGENRQCITCDNKILTKGVKRGLGAEKGRYYRTAPAWHPSCEFMAIEIGTKHFRPTRYERAPFGVNHSLWLIAADGSWAEEIVAIGENDSASRPHFSETGDRLFWSGRKATGKRSNQWNNLLTQGPGGEDPWVGWYLSIADFARPEGGPAALSNRVDLYRPMRGYFGATALAGDTIWFSHTRGGYDFIDDLYRAKLDGSARKKVFGDSGS